ncbi:hypothetical protein PVAP13_9NG229073 [Panicum virgatum]|uniref:Uncharacterized protein n=1 Tax=Panicum virgatum TaxID=38727 RepID=A0A8T0MHN3_PANVG|nr:hypothetical protein PVAP13_9NG229073 [Panicum virgatum]
MAGDRKDADAEAVVRVVAEPDFLQDLLHLGFSPEDVVLLGFPCGILCLPGHDRGVVPRRHDVLVHGRAPVRRLRHGLECFSQSVQIDTADLRLGAFAMAMAVAASNCISRRAEAEQEPERAARLPRRSGGGLARLPGARAVSRHGLDVVEGVVRGVGGVEQVLHGAPAEVHGARVGGVQHAPHGREEALVAAQVARGVLVELGQQLEALADEAGEHGGDEAGRRPSRRGRQRYHRPGGLRRCHWVIARCVVWRERLGDRRWVEAIVC